MNKYPNSDYQELLRHHRTTEGKKNEEIRRKRRKLHDSQFERDGTASTTKETEVITVESDSNSTDDDDFEDVDLGLPAVPENVEIKAAVEAKPLVISIENTPAPPKKKKFHHISKEQRVLRKLMHQEYVVMMIVHGATRNYWCNDYELMTTLKKSVPNSVLQLLDSQDKNSLPMVKSRRLLDGLKQLMTLFSKKFHVTAKGLILKNWHELGQIRSKVDRDVNVEKFKSLAVKFRGSRDIAAQTFVSLLRSMGLNARLVFSLQPPDFTSISETAPKVRERAPETKQPTVISRFRDSKHNLLASVRSKAQTQEARRSEPEFVDSEYPIFWAEVWDKYAKKWVSIDPIVMKVIEIAPMRRKSKFEPPTTEPRNQLIYAIAYDRLGGVKDVTRRYSHYYNAKTVKKRIDSKSEDDELWYHKVIRSVNSDLRKRTKLDILEMKEFHDRDLAEGMPNNIADFKNHPTYVLESQLKQNEVIYPKDQTSKCGTFRNKSKSKGDEVITVYKRSHVYTLRSAKAWYMRGRILKVGVQPLKLKKKPAAPLADDEELEEDVRLYAEFQTQMYIPPPIENGIIPKNAFGNIDCYTAQMIPENGFLVPIEKYPMKLCEAAAKILNIDYAKAVVAFDFANRRTNRVPKTKEGGILIDKQYKAAILLVLDHLVQEQEELLREAQELRALKFWKYFLTKLRINDRLDRQHGKVEIEEEDKSDSYSVCSDNSGSDVDGGFIDEGYKRVTSPDDVEEIVHNREDVNEFEDIENFEDNQGEDDRFTTKMEEYDDFGGGFIHEVSDKELENSPEDIEEDAIDNDYEEDDFSAGGFIYDDGEAGFEEDKSSNLTSTKKETKSTNINREIMDSRGNAGLLGESINQDEDSDEMPDSLFSYNDQGELVYDPHPHENFAAISKNNATFHAASSDEKYFKREEEDDLRVVPSENEAKEDSIEMSTVAGDAADEKSHRELQLEVEIAAQIEANNATERNVHETILLPLPGQESIQASQDGTVEDSKEDYVDDEFGFEYESD